jgi:hypothetical protein
MRALVARVALTAVVATFALAAVVAVVAVVPRLPLSQSPRLSCFWRLVCSFSLREEQ